jgi:twitching motility protein PilT
MDIKELLKTAVDSNASDLHILPGMPPMLRVHGDLIPVNNGRLTPEDTKQLIESVMTSHQREIFEKKLLLETALITPGLSNFRVSAFHQIHGEAAVFRVIPTTVPTFEELLLPQVLKRLLVISYGLVLVTGPTGSGKSTTLAAMVDFINKIQAAHIITIEDPVEFVHTSKKSAINQLQVGRDTPDFATALRASLRQDPDVIMLGELRDLDTIRLALTAAETGHLVLASLHASSSPLAINRIIDIFPNAEKNRVRNLLSETIQAVVCQTLVKKLKGGLTGAFEIMLATPAIRHMIHQDMISQMSSTIQTSGDIGMNTMEQYLQELVMKQIISPSAARSAIINQDAFQL